MCLEPGCMQMMSSYFDFRRHRAFAHKHAPSSSSSSSRSSGGDRHAKVANRDDGGDDDSNKEDDINYFVDTNADDEEDVVLCQEIPSTRKRKGITGDGSEHTQSRPHLSSSSGSDREAATDVATTAENSSFRSCDAESSGRERVATGSRRGSDVELFHCDFPNCLRKFTLVRCIHFICRFYFVQAYFHLDTIF